MHVFCLPGRIRDAAAVMQALPYAFARRAAHARPEQDRHRGEEEREEPIHDPKPGFVEGDLLQTIYRRVCRR